MDLKELIVTLKKTKILNYAFVGSTVTVADKNLTKNSDRDILILVDKINDLKYQLTADNWDLESYIDDSTPTPDSTFVSFRKAKVNIIATESTEFFSKFLTATEVAKLLNLVDKTNRIKLFQYILYGNTE